jgi:hypothetical protein
LLSAGALDRSDRFRALLVAARGGWRQVPIEARHADWILVGGLFTERYPGYFDHARRRMEELGLDVWDARIDTDATVGRNAAKIRELIRTVAARTGRLVVLVAHSKGGCDVGAALSGPDAPLEHVAAVVSMGAPWRGTPLAEDLANSELRDTVADIIRRHLHGDPDALFGMSYTARAAFLAENPYPSHVPTVSLAAGCRNPTSSLAIPIAWLAMRHKGLADGLVMRRDAVLPGSDVVWVDDIDHAAPALHGLSGVGAPGSADIVQAMVTLAMERVARER